MNRLIVTVMESASLLICPLSSYQYGNRALNILTLLESQLMIALVYCYYGYKAVGLINRDSFSDAWLIFDYWLPW